MTDATSTSVDISRQSPADVLRLAVGVVLLVALVLLAALFGETLVGFASDLLRGLDALPDWLVRGFVAAVRVVALLALVAGLVVTAMRTGGRMILTVGVAAGVAVVLALLLDDVPHIPEAD